MDITHDNVCSSMLSCFYSHLLSTGRPISSCVLVFETKLAPYQSLMANRRVIISKRPYISLIIVSLASKYEKYLSEIMVCESFVEHLVGSVYF